MSLIDNNQIGDDNRGTTTGLGYGSDRTDANGEARITISVSMQPGDNYRAAASVIQEAVTTQINQAMADALSATQVTNTDGTQYWTIHVGANGLNRSFYQVPTVWSPMLTVWRKLHVEVDSMAASNFTNTETGLIPAAPTYDAATGHAVVPIAALDVPFKAIDQHKVGRIDILTFGSFTTVATTLAPYTVEIINAPANIATAIGLSYTLWDDDAGSVPPFTMVGFDAPPVTLPKAPNTTLMASAYNNAYVEPVVADPVNYAPSTVFTPNVEGVAAARDKGNENASLTSTKAFWVVHITSGFQGYIAKDNDPKDEEAQLGLQYGITIITGLIWKTSSGSMVYLETIRDHARGVAVDMSALEQYTVVHESGHQFLLIHKDGQSPPLDDSDPVGDYIMTDVLGQTAMAPNKTFSATSLKKIRTIDFPPVEN